jgi:hypothetical protein
MSITSKVVAIDEKSNSVIARDTKAHRIIINMGRERLALDVFSRLTKLPPHTGDEPAAVLALNPISHEKRKRGRSKRERD